MRVHLPSENPITTLTYLNVPPGGRVLLGQRPLEQVELYGPRRLPLREFNTCLHFSNYKPL